ncbi:MAG TPA: chromate transporter [Bacillota bacterium]|nr:chromate transporter [Bacillota bacterium]
MILLELFLTFAKIGLFTIGGGYAMIPLIQEEIVERSWMTLEGVIDIIAISEMTPGPFAINAATFIGIQQHGLLGAVFATTGVVAPTFIIVLLVARYFTKFKDHPLVQGLLKGIRPAVIGLIATATFTIIKSVFSISPTSIITIANIKSIIILGLVLLGIYKLKIHPAIMIILSAIMGMFFFIW